MYEKISRWLGLIERFVDLIRPKAYNAIAKFVVFTGITLIVESQVNFFHALVVALFEQYLGKSEILREVLVATDSPSLGIFLVVSGMFYHVVVTLGKDFIETKKATLPKYPELPFSLSTAKKSKLYSDVVLDGPALIVPNVDEIPDYSEKKERVDENKESSSLFHAVNSSPLSIMGSRRKVYTNTGLFKQRAELLENWSGFEPLEIHLSNRGKVLANGVRVNVLLPKSNNSLFIKMPKDKLPSQPEKTFTNEAYMTSSFLDHDIFSLADKIRITDNDEYYEIDWDIGTLQAGVITTGNKTIFLRVKEAVEITCTVFCDDLPEPKSSLITINPPEDYTQLNIEDITDDDKFNPIYLQCMSLLR